jgi:hypothetical protein
MSIDDVETRLGLLLLTGEAECGPGGWRLVGSGAR